MNNIILRKACEDDKDFIASVCRSAEEMYKNFEPGFFEGQAKIFEKKLPAGYEIDIIESENIRVGFMVNKIIDNSTNYLVMLFFLPKFQRMGYGKAVMELLEERLKKGNIKYLALLADKRAEWAVNFYKKYNLTISGVNKNEILSYKYGILAPFYLDNTILFTKSL